MGCRRHIILIEDLNTSHVLIYPITGKIVRIQDGFKYISCSYLSKRNIFRPCGRYKFKYISCSYLSNKRRIDFGWFSRFKYISCSYLSSVMCPSKFQKYYLNTSHVLIYHQTRTFSLETTQFKYISCSYLSLKIGKQCEVIKHLNTSHVLIYPLITVCVNVDCNLNTSHVLIYH